MNLELTDEEAEDLLDVIAWITTRATKEGDIGRLTKLYANINSQFNERMGVLAQQRANAARASKRYRDRKHARARYIQLPLEG